MAALVALVQSEPRLISVLNADALARLSSSGSGKAFDEALASLMLRQKVWHVRRKAQELSSDSPEHSEDILASFQLPANLAARCGLPEVEGQTWLDAIQEIKRAATGESPAELWQRVERHPMVEYVHVQCQSCGKKVPDLTTAPEDPNLTEEEPTEQERHLVRAGWFRGPRGAVVFIYSCPDCGAKSRWFRALRPEVTLNPHRWGRLCGEQEDLKTWLARYLGIRLRICCPLDWDHVWTEVFDGTQWRPLDPNCVNFARRLHEGIGSWTGVLAIGTLVSGGSSSADATEEVTEAYLMRAAPQELSELTAWHAQINAARADDTGRLTQARTLCGHTLERAGFSSDRVTEELRKAQTDFDAGRQWYDIDVER